jgi:hypothetical protein
MLEKDCFQQRKESCERERGGNKKKQQTSRGARKLGESEQGHKNECKVETAKTTPNNQKKKKEKKRRALEGGVAKGSMKSKRANKEG